MKHYLFVIICLFSFISTYPQETEIKKATSLIENGCYLDAAKILRPLAEGGNSQAQYLAARLFVEGKGVIKSIEQAEKFYQLAAYNGHNNAAIELCDLYDSNNQPQKASQLLVDLCNKNTDRENSLLGFYLGYYYYTGHGNMNINKLLGWGMMFRSKHHLNDEGSAIFNKLKDDFYHHLLQTTEPDLLCQYLGYYYWKYMSKPEWAANYLDDLAIMLKKLPYEKQIEHFKVWEKNRLISEYKDAAAVVLGILYAEGIGCTRDMTKAKNCYSVIDNETYSILYNNLYEHMNTGNEGHLNIKDFPNFTSIIHTDYVERKERMTYDTKKNNIQAKCTVPQTKAEFWNASWNNGTLKVTFNIYNKAMNQSRITVLDGGTCKDIKGNYKNGDAKIATSNTYILPKGENTFLTVKFKNMPPSGELEYVKVTMKCQYGKGTISASNLVWDVKYQH